MNKIILTITVTIDATDLIEKLGPTRAKSTVMKYLTSHGAIEEVQGVFDELTEVEVKDELIPVAVRSVKLT